MENHSTETSSQPNPSAAISKRIPATKTAVKQVLTLLCLAHSRQYTPELEQVYWLALSDCSMEQVQSLAAQSLKETEFWPSPGRLRKLRGIPDAAERVEIEAREALVHVLSSLKATRAYCDNEARSRWVEGVPEKGFLPISMVPAKRIVSAMVGFGGGSLDGAVEILIQHPRFRTSESEQAGLGYDLSAIDKLEKRWLATWKEVFRGGK